MSVTLHFQLISPIHSALSPNSRLRDAPLNGKKSYRGTLESFGEGEVTLQTDGGETLRLPRIAISKLQTVYFD